MSWAQISHSCVTRNQYRSPSLTENTLQTYFKSICKGKQQKLQKPVQSGVFLTPPLTPEWIIHRFTMNSKIQKFTGGLKRRLSLSLLPCSDISAIEAKPKGIMTGRGGVAEEGGQGAQKGSEFTLKDMLGELWTNCIPSPATVHSANIYLKAISKVVFFLNL